MTHDINASGTTAIQELQQKLAMGAEEVKTVKADLTSQLQQTMEVAEYAKEQCEEERRQAQAMESELIGKSQAIQELEDKFRQEKEWWGTIRMWTELDGLRQLEDVRKQFDRKRKTQKGAGAASIHP